MSMASNSTFASSSRPRDAVRWIGLALGAGLTVVGLVLMGRGVYNAFPLVGGFGDDSDGPLIRESGRHEIVASLLVLLIAVGLYAWARAWSAAICTGIALALAGLLDATTPTSSNLFYLGLLLIAALCLGGLVVELRSMTRSRAPQ
jgi:hypothetical protein